MHLKKINSVSRVLSSREMQNIEKLAIAEGASAFVFMQTAGQKIAEKILELFKKSIKNKHIKAKNIVLAAGKGNNAGDGFVVLLQLLKAGFKTRCLNLYPEKYFSPLASQTYQQYLSAGGKSLCLKEQKSEEQTEIFSEIFAEDAIILDGIFGSGLKGEIDPMISQIIEKINQTKNYKISIDIPSGLDGDTGEIKPVAVKADLTCYLGAPKRGFFLENGFEQVGKLVKIDFGLDKKFLQTAQADFELLEKTGLGSQLPEIKRTQHKYEAGYVVGLSGSVSMEGAANLAARAALRSGSGMVRLFLAGGKSDYKKIDDEIIKEHLKTETKELNRIVDMCNQAGAVFVGPGLGRTKAIAQVLKAVLPQIKKPLVIDADGLYFLAQNPDLKLPENIVLTPHKGEMLRLLNEKDKSIKDEKLLEKCQKFTEKKNCILVLKGAPSFIFQKQKRPLIIARGDPGMATAGSGDVLTGMIAAFSARKNIKKANSFLKAAVLAVFIHSLAGEKAAEKKSSYSLMASDLIESLPDVFKDLSENAEA